jgi:hypothetical protein
MRPVVPNEAEYFLATGRIKTPGWSIRMVVRCRRRLLDARLAEGVNPLADPRLAARARQLSEMRTRERVAERLEAVADRFPACAQPGRAGAGAAPCDPEALSDPTRRALLDLASALRVPWPVNEQGVALAATLARDCSLAMSHVCAAALIYRADAQESTRAAARRARACLERGPAVDSRAKAQPRDEE